MYSLKYREIIVKVYYNLITKINDYVLRKKHKITKQNINKNFKIAIIIDFWVGVQ